MLHVLHSTFATARCALFPGNHAQSSAENAPSTRAFNATIDLDKGLLKLVMVKLDEYDGSHHCIAGLLTCMLAAEAMHQRNCATLHFNAPAEMRR